MKNPTREAVRRYCVANDLFTVGGNEQYSKMLDALETQLPLHDIATIIWICSDTDKHADEIENDLRQLALECERFEEDLPYRREGSL